MKTQQKLQGRLWKQSFLPLCPGYIPLVDSDHRALTSYCPGKYKLLEGTSGRAAWLRPQIQKHKQAGNAKLFLPKDTSPILPAALRNTHSEGILVHSSFPLTYAEKGNALKMFRLGTSLHEAQRSGTSFSSPCTQHSAWNIARTQYTRALSTVITAILCRQPPKCRAPGKAFQDDSWMRPIPATCIGRPYKAARKQTPGAEHL